MLLIALECSHASDTNPDPRLEWPRIENWAGYSGKPYWRTNLFKRVLTDQVWLARQWWPGEVRRPKFYLPMAVALAGAAGSSVNGIDLRIQREMTSWASSPGRRDVAESLTRLGDADTAAILLGGSWLISKWTGNERLTRATSLSAEALVNSAVYTTLLKRATRRTRPSHDGIGQFFVQSPQAGQEATSFPSGHAAGAFAVAAVLASEYRHRRWVPWTAYGTASLISLSRVSLGRHFPSDVIAGAVLGRSLGKAVVRRNGDEWEEPTSRIEPLIDPANAGFGLMYRRSW